MKHPLAACNKWYDIEPKRLEGEMLRLTACVAMMGALAISVSSRAQVPQDDQPDPAKLSLARELYAAQGGQAALDARLRGMFQVTNAEIVKSLPAEQRRFAMALQNNMERQVVVAAGGMMDGLLRIYARTFTEKELRDNLAWVRSDSGQSINGKMPAIQHELMTEMVPVFMKMGQSIAKAAMDETCAQEHCTTHDHDVIADVIAKKTPRTSS